MLHWALRRAQGPRTTVGSIVASWAQVKYLLVVTEYFAPAGLVLLPFSPTATPNAISLRRSFRMRALSTLAHAIQARLG